MPTKRSTAVMGKMDKDNNARVGMQRVQQITGRRKLKIESDGSAGVWNQFPNRAPYSSFREHESL